MKLINERLAPIIASLVAFTLSIIKTIIWFISGSVALLSSAIDSLMDMAVSTMNYFAIKLSLKPADKNHQYWHGKIEWIATSIEWAIIFLSGAFIIYKAIRKIINPEPIIYLKSSIIAMIASIILTLWLIVYLHKVYKKSNNLVIKWDIVHYKTDLITNIWVLITLIIIYFTNLIIIDWIVGFILGIYVIEESIKLIKNWIDILMDKALNETYKIEEILKNAIKRWKINSYYCLKTRAIGSKKKYVEFHIVVDSNLTVEKSHNIWNEIKSEIIKLDPKSIRYVCRHIEPNYNNTVKN